MQVDTDEIRELVDQIHEDQDAERDKPPKNAERFIVAQRYIGAYYDADWDDDPHFEPPDGAEPGDKLRFEQDDPLPRSLVERVWDAFGDRIIPIDESGEKIGKDKRPLVKFS